MCTLFLALDRHPRWTTVLVGNRDEAYARPTHPAHWWTDAPDLLAGRDLSAGGTWLGVTRAGRWAVVTNVRDLPAHRERPRSRGDLPVGFLTRDVAPLDYAREVADSREEVNPFNLLVGDGSAVAYASSHVDSARSLGPGVYGLSNATLDVPWPKVARGRERFSALLKPDDLDPEDVFAMLAHDAIAPDDSLPETGVGLVKERALSALFIRMPGYGTRVSYVLLLDADGRGRFWERSFVDGETAATLAFEIGPT